MCLHVIPVIDLAPVCKLHGQDSLGGEIPVDHGNLDREMCNRRWDVQVYPLHLHIYSPFSLLWSCLAAIPLITVYRRKMWVRNIKVGRMTDEPVKTITFVIGPNLNKIIFYSAKFYVSVKLNWSNKNAQYTETRKKKKKVTFLTVST